MSSVVVLRVAPDGVDLVRLRLLLESGLGRKVRLYRASERIGGGVLSVGAWWGAAVDEGHVDSLSDPNLLSVVRWLIGEGEKVVGCVSQLEKLRVLFGVGVREWVESAPVSVPEPVVDISEPVGVGVVEDAIENVVEVASDDAGEREFGSVTLF